VRKYAKFGAFLRLMFYGNYILIFPAVVPHRFFQFVLFWLGAGGNVLLFMRFATL
jgi:hypothetical protein